MNGFDEYTAPGSWNRFVDNNARKCEEFPHSHSDEMDRLHDVDRPTIMRPGCSQSSKELAMRLINEGKSFTAINKGMDYVFLVNENR